MKLAQYVKLKYHRMKITYKDRNGFYLEENLFLAQGEMNPQEGTVVLCTTLNRFGMHKYDKTNISA